MKRLLPDVLTEERALETGDYLWDTPAGAVVVERKELHTDLLASIQGERWAAQTSRLADIRADGGLPLILVEGEMSFAGEALLLPGRAISRWSRDGILNTLLVAQMRGIAVTSSGRGPHAVGRRIASLYHLTLREDHQTTVVRRRRPFEELRQDEAQALGVLSALPGCGLPTARRLLQVYGSVTDVLTAILDGDAGRSKVVPKRRAARWREVLMWRKDSGGTSVTTPGGTSGGAGTAPGAGIPIGSRPRQYQDGSALRGSRE